MVRVPELLSGVTSEWLTAALRSSGHLEQGAVVVSAIQAIGSEFGFASRVGRVQLAFDRFTPSLPSSVVVKLAGPSVHMLHCGQGAKHSWRYSRFGGGMPSRRTTIWRV